ncbi:MAG: hypothetical protein R3F41_17490 [Gammaproteobacteria bacterium]|nr:hypothetical protein [Pseudomonadales bacterium]MCP5347344.1 hypothetical protein [Pseudomonadales bacterium]
MGEDKHTKVCQVFITPDMIRVNMGIYEKADFLVGHFMDGGHQQWEGVIDLPDRRPRIKANMTAKMKVKFEARVEARMKAKLKTKTGNRL